jgi:hypothetical protein
MDMKQNLVFSKLFLVAIFFLTVNQAFSGVLTVSNNTAISAQYNSISAAFSAANPGDTVFIHGSPNSYGDVTLNKRLVVIGPGYTPTNPTSPTAVIGYFYLDTLVGVSGASGTYVAGLVINNFYSSGNYNGRVLNNITIRRNYITSYLTVGSSNTEVHNWLIYDNIINYLSYSINTSTSTNILINNNLFNYSYNVYKSIYTNNVIYNNPIFSYCTVQNNIFVTGVNNNNTSDHNTFNNNLFSSAITFTNGTNTFSPALVANTTTGNADPQFNGGTGTSFLSISDYHLKTASAGHNAGTDGMDLGIYGGTGFTWGGTPPVPMIYFYNIKPNYVQSNGTLNITVSVKNQ